MSRRFGLRKRVGLVYLVCIAAVVAVEITLFFRYRMLFFTYGTIVMGPVYSIVRALRFPPAGVMLTLLAAPVILAPCFMRGKLAIVLSIIGILIWLAIGNGYL